VRAPAKTKKPEVLSPAGGFEQLKAAVENGADAVYFGVENFNARARANNFTYEELPRVMDYLRARGVKGYVTVNVLIFDEEMEEVKRCLTELANAGVDALIVQDLGLVRLAKKLVPELPIHGSTQMSITTGEGAEFARRHGVERVVVGRELSVRDIKMVGETSDAEVEVFVHGALCVSYSGQCFSSEAWGGRSANRYVYRISYFAVYSFSSPPLSFSFSFSPGTRRGQCAQACRMPYGLVVDGVVRDLQDVKYLLSPQDLMAVDQIPELIDAGVSCFKIEGRLKGPEYVALTTQVYRQAVDAAWDQRTRDQLDPASEPFSLTAHQRRDLKQVFARGQDATHDGLTSGFLAGTAHQSVVRGKAPKSRGVYLGEVIHTRPGNNGDVVFTFRIPDNSVGLKLGDGIVFDNGSPEHEVGGAIYSLRWTDAAETTCEISLGVRFKSSYLVHPGSTVWRTRDLELENRLKKTFTNVADVNKRRQPVKATVRCHEGEPLHLELTTVSGNATTSVSTEACLAPAFKRPVDEEAVRKALGDLGGTTFRIVDLVFTGDNLAASNLFLPVGQIKEARRVAVEQLLSQIREQAGYAVVDLPKVDPVYDVNSEDNSSLMADGQPIAAQFSVLCRKPEQVQVILDHCTWVDEIIVDFLEVQGLEQAVRQVQAAGRRAVAAFPRVTKPDEDRLTNFYLKLKADGLLVRSAGLLESLLRRKETSGDLKLVMPSLYGDFSLNASNAVSADLFLTSGIQRLCPTHDLNSDQLIQLAATLHPRYAPEKLEVVIHQHLPIFHTEHCVFCRFLSEGNSYKDCGHPCEKHEVSLRDGQGDHVVLADMGCRNTVFNSQSQSGVHNIHDFMHAGFGRFRIELLDEKLDAIPALVEGYRAVLHEVTSADEHWEFLQQLPNIHGKVMGSTLGSLVVRNDKSFALKTTAAAKKAAERRGTLTPLS
jgi:U32 family peptidase